MRMWMVDPRMLCRSHLLGEHAEIHKHRHNFVRGDSMTGRIFPVVQIEPLSMGLRHERLAAEMVRRGYHHDSPFVQPDLSGYPVEVREARVDISNSEAELSERCPECARRINYWKGAGSRRFRG